MISFRNRIALFIITTSIAFAGCTKVNTTAKTDSPKDDIFSNRPINPGADLYVVTLTSPPILAIAKKTKDGWNVPAHAKAKLLAEQAKFENELKKLAPDAQIIYRYRMTINAFAVFTSSEVTEQLLNLPGVKAVTPALAMARPQELDVKPAQAVTPVNSVNFIGAEEAHKKGYTGKGMRIGIIDTGIDYTHAMLGGRGQADDYKSIDPAKPNALFPNDKVVGGRDFVGTDFNAASVVTAAHRPIPDDNPLDEEGHGSHVAGTIAGRGDGVNTYDGVAPDAQLYALKVFGKDGSTADAAVIAAFEYAADPNGDLNPDDQLDVINMSLGGGFGQPHILYNEAVKNLSNAGTVVVASAGNSGPLDYIVGAPSTANEALSVAASIDGSLVNWSFAAVRFSPAKVQPLYVKAVEGPISKPIAQISAVSGELVSIGDASEDLSDDVKAQLRGKVALIARGKVPFADKLKRAVDAGAIGAVVYTNDSKDPIPMGGDGKFDIPAIMVSQAVGMQLIAYMQASPVTIDFKTDKKIEEPQRIDTITSFSSKGPRSEDNLIKPEIAAPGQNITSVAMGTGTKGVLMDGTSMASPHMTGAIALLKQAHPGLSAKEYKSLAMDTAKVLTQDAADIPITLQGAGRIQIDQALETPVVSESPSLSLGRVQLQERKTLYRTIVLRNLTKNPVTLATAVKSVAGLAIDLPSSVTVPAEGEEKVLARFEFTLQNADQFSFELDGRIFFKQGDKVVLQIPAMAIRTQASVVSAQASADSVQFSNGSPNTGMAMAFNLLGESSRKPAPPKNEAWKSRACDLESAGYRILRKTADNGATVNVIDFAFKVFDPVTTWIVCEPSVLIDSDGDGIADQEVAGITGASLEGLQGANFSTVVLDAAKARALRLEYEKALSAGKSDAKVDYTSALIAGGGMLPFEQSTLMVIEVPLDPLTPAADGKLHVKLATQSESETFQPDKFLGGGPDGSWLTISPKAEDQAYSNLAEVTIVPPTGGSLSLTKGNGKEKLVIYYPVNEYKADGKDGQQQIF